MILPELIAEETRLASLSSSTHVPEMAFFASSHQGKERNLSKVRCYSCHELGHLANQCKKKKGSDNSNLFCRYCKEQGHLIDACKKRPPKKQHPKAYAVTTSENNHGPSLTLLEEQLQQVIQALQASTTGNNGIRNSWILDSSATHHMTGNLDILHHLSPNSTFDNILAANGQSLSVKKIGNITITPFDSAPLHLSNVLYIPDLCANLISVGQLVKQNCLVSFSASGCIIQNLRTGKIIGKGRRNGELFALDFEQSSNPSICFLAPSSHEKQVANKLSQLWHCRLGHPHALNSLFKSGLLPEKLNPRSDIHKICDDCVLAKSHVLPFNSSVTRTVSSFDLVHSDVWGPSRVGSLTGKFYYVTFIDDWSRFS